MAAPEQVEAWKKEYGQIYSASTKKAEYIFREISFAEYDKALEGEGEGSAEKEDELVRTALLYPVDPDFDRIPAGFISSLAEEILAVSGFTDLHVARKILDEARVKTQEVRGMMKSFVIAAMPAYKEEELDQMTFRQLAAKVALAESVIKVNQTAFGIEAAFKLDLIDPEEEAARHAQEVKKHNAQRKPGTAALDDPIAHKLASALG